MIGRAAQVSFLLTFVYYVAALCPGAYWLDSSEFAAASYLLGVAHPPGHPLALIVGKAFTLLPLGPIAFRVGLGQAACGALAAALMTLCGARIASRMLDALGQPLGGPRGEALAAFIGLAAALCTSLGYAAAFQSMRPEVYALHRVLAVGSFLCLTYFDESRDRRYLLLAALLLGLGLANHHFLAILSTLPVPLVLLGERHGKARIIAGCFAAGAVGLLLYFYLPLRAAHHPLVNWGSPTTLSRIFWTVSAKAFQKSVKEPQPGDEDVVGAMIEGLHPVGAVLMAIGLYLLIRQRPTRGLGCYCLAAVGLVAGGRAVLGFDVANPDAYGYLVPAIDLAALCGCAGAAGLCALMMTMLLMLRAEQKGRLALSLACVLALLGAAHGGKSFARIDRSGFFDLDTLAGSWLAEAPPGSWLVSSYFQTVFALWYLQGVEGQRPDVLHLHPHFLPNPGYREDLLARHPDVADLGAVLGPRGLSMGPLLQARSRRPILVEYDLDTQEALLPYLYPHGLQESLEIGPGQALMGTRDAEAKRRRDEVAGRLDARDAETAKNLLWRGYLGMTLSCQQRDPGRFQAEYARIRRLLGQSKSPEIENLIRRCAP